MTIEPGKNKQLVADVEQDKGTGEVPELQDQLASAVRKINELEERLALEKKKNDELIRTDDSEKIPQKVEYQISRRNEFENLILEIFARFANVGIDNITSEMEWAVQKLAEASTADACQIYLFQNDGRVVREHAWHASTIKRSNISLLEFDKLEFPWFLEQVQNHEAIFIKNVDAMPDEAWNEKQELRKWNIRSFICLPLIYNSRLIGIIGFDWIQTENKWTPKIIPLLKIAADLFAAALGKKLVAREAEEAIHTSEVTARVLLNASTDLAILISDDGRLLEWNDIVPRRTKKNRQELGNTTIYDLIPPDVVKRRKPFLNQVIQLGQPARFEEKIGKSFWDISLYPIKLSNDQVNRCAIFGRDITDRHQAEKERTQLEQQLLQSQKLEAIGTLAGGIAHDFNNLLTGIIGNINMAQLDADSEVHEFLNNAESAASRAATLVTQLLTFSRKSQTQFKIVDPSGIVEEISGILQETIDRRIAVNLTIPDKCWPIFADMSQIHQVIMNLCINARDAITDELDVRNQGALEIGTASYRISISMENRTVTSDSFRINPEAKPGRYVMLRVEDNGPGMDEETLSRIFEPFFTTKEQGRGTGLGLSTVFGIIKQHKGWVDVTSASGKGTVFDVYLPVHDLSISEHRDKDAFTSSQGGKETVLLVDDERIVRDLGRAILERKGYAIYTAEDGKRGLELFAREKDRIDLVILDQTMPYLSGKELLQQILLIEPEMKVLMSSGYVDAEQEKKFMELGAVGFVAKPYNVENLSRHVRKALD